MYAADIGTLIPPQTEPEMGESKMSAGMNACILVNKMRLWRLFIVVDFRQSRPRKQCLLMHIIICNKNEFSGQCQAQICMHVERTKSM